MTDEALAENIARDPDATDADGVALRIQMIRNGLSLSQAQFAARSHIPLATLKDWEQARRQTAAAAWAYLQVIEGEPAAVAAPLKQPKPGRRSPGAEIPAQSGYTAQCR